MGAPDCTECHNVKGFTGFSFTDIERHNEPGSFPLKGAHRAIPCYECHKKQEKWSFREIGIDCKDCHEDIHQQFIHGKVLPGCSCKACHSESVGLRYLLIIKNSFQPYRLSALRRGLPHLPFQRRCRRNCQTKIYRIARNCSACHTDNHVNQFERNGKTDCTECHDTVNWKPVRFDHSKTAFKLEAAHEKVRM